MIIMALTATMLASCTSDDDEHKIKSQTISFQCEPNDVLLEMADLTITYTDASGNTHSEPLTSLFTKTITVTKFPAQGAFKVKATLKETFDEKKVLYKTPKLSYTYICGISKQPGDIQQMLITSRSDLNALIEKINSAIWKWDIATSGVITHN